MEPTVDELQKQNAVLQAQIDKLTNRPNILVRIFGANWRTSVTGWLTGLTGISGDLLDAYNRHEFNNMHGIVLFLSVLSVIKGIVTKDKHVTGGSEANTIK